VIILVVVRDEDVRGLIGLMLSAFDVLVAADEDEALAIASSVEVDLLLTELGLPTDEEARSVDGRSLAGRLGSPALYITSWFDHPDFIRLDGERIVKEPFSRDDLMRAIDAVGS